MYLRAGKPKSRFEDRWMEDLFLGVQDRSDEAVIGTREEVDKTRMVCRGSSLNWSGRCPVRNLEEAEARVSSNRMDIPSLCQ